MAETPFGKALIDLAEEDPQRPALTVGPRTLTRRQLCDRVRDVASYFRELGVTPGSMVSIGLPNSIELVEAVFATWHLGAIPQPISHRLPPAEQAAILELASPSLVVGFPAAAGEGPASIDSIPMDLPAGEPTTPAVSPNWKLMTSGGSTGRPKLIMAVEPGVMDSVAGTIALLRLPKDGGVLVTGPMSHNAPFGITTVGILAGNHVVLMPKFDPHEALQLVQTHRINWLYLVPTMMLRIWRLPEAERLSYDLSSLEVAFHMAAPCPRWLKEAWLGWLGPDVVYELYGGTEVQSVSVISGHEWLDHPGSVGRPVMGEMQIRDASGRPLGPDEIGDIWMRRGEDAPVPYRYIGARARTADGGWECLGDIGYIDHDGYVYITDRDADMILVGGANVYPAEIEAAIEEHPAVRSCCVVGLPHEDLGSAPHAIVELAEHVSDEELLEHLRSRLAPYKLPRSIERAHEPLRDDAGKVRRSALRASRLPSGT